MSRRRKSKPQFELFTIETAAKPHAIPPDVVQAAKEILEWRLGPRPPQWRVLRLAQALKNAG